MGQILMSKKMTQKHHKHHYSAADGMRMTWETSADIWATHLEDTPTVSSTSKSMSTDHRRVSDPNFFVKVAYLETAKSLFWDSLSRGFLFFFTTEVSITFKVKRINMHYSNPHFQSKDKSDSNHAKDLLGD